MKPKKDKVYASIFYYFQQLRNSFPVNCLEVSKLFLSISILTKSFPLSLLLIENISNFESVPMRKRKKTYSLFTEYKILSVEQHDTHTHTFFQFSFVHLL